MAASSRTNNSNANPSGVQTATGGNTTSITSTGTAAAAVTPPVGGGAPPANVANGNEAQAVQQPLKHDPGISVEWSNEEQSILEESLTKFGNESSLNKYIKIAALLQEKTVRDVALRWRWMSKKENGKRRKAEEAKKSKEKKEKSIESTPKPLVPPAARPTMPTYPLPPLPVDNDDGISSEAIGGSTGQLFEQNSQVINQIRNNLAAYKLQENTDLLVRFRDNIFAILNSMKDTPGIMSQMPPLPVKLNAELADTILPKPTPQISAPLPT